MRSSSGAGSLDAKPTDDGTAIVAVSPNISLLLQFDQVLSQLLFSYHIDWLDDSKYVPVYCNQLNLKYLFLSGSSQEYGQCGCTV
jgi:hypothetical protein